MNENQITLREYLQNYTKMRQQKVGVQNKSIGFQHNLKMLENHTNFIKDVLISKVNGSVYHNIVSHLDQIQDLFRLTANQLLNQNQSQICISTVGKLSKKRVKTFKKLQNKDTKQNLQVSMSLKIQSNCSPSPILKYQNKLGQTNATQITFLKTQEKQNWGISNIQKKKKIKFIIPSDFQKSQQNDFENQLRYTCKRSGFSSTC